MNPYDFITLAAIAFFTFLALVLIVPAWLRHRLRMNALARISDALAQGRTSDAELIEKLLLPPRAAVGKWFTLICLFLGVSSLAIGIALGLSAALLDHGPSEASGLMMGAVMNACIGSGLTCLGVIGFWRFSGLKRAALHWDYAAVLALISLFLGAASLSIGSGLALSGLLFGGRAPGSAAGFFTAALVNACSGIGFTALGSFILWAFQEREA